MSSSSIRNQQTATAPIIPGNWASSRDAGQSGRAAPRIVPPSAGSPDCLIANAEQTRSSSADAVGTGSSLPLPGRRRGQTARAPTVVSTRYPHPPGETPTPGRHSTFPASHAPYPASPGLNPGSRLAPARCCHSWALAYQHQGLLPCWFGPFIPDRAPNFTYHAGIRRPSATLRSGLSKVSRPLRAIRAEASR